MSLTCEPEIGRIFVDPRHMPTLISGTRVPPSFDARAPSCASMPKAMIHFGQLLAMLT